MNITFGVRIKEIHCTCNIPLRWCIIQLRLPYLHCHSRKADQPARWSVQSYILYLNVEKLCIFIFTSIELKLNLNTFKHDCFVPPLISVLFKLADWVRLKKMVGKSECVGFFSLFNVALYQTPLPLNNTYTFIVEFHTSVKKLFVHVCL